MDGIHDMGGMHGFGPVEREEDEPVFHEAWEKRAFAISLLAADSVGFVDDQLRRSIERIPPRIYLTASYYELWMRSVEAILEEMGILTPAEIDRRVEELKREGGDG
jgi:nitrile hydratase subunit beta